jgi:hypothetical protein
MSFTADIRDTCMMSSFSKDLECPDMLEPFTTTHRTAL